MADRTPTDRAHPRPLSLIPQPDQDQIAARIPAPLSSFIGRDQEIASIAALLGRADMRLLTLTGPGGIGKTRLARRVMEPGRDTAHDGVAWVSLAPVHDPGLVLPTMTQALDVPDAAGQSLLEQVRAYLQDRHLLLVLDNLEHFLDAIAPLVADLLATCPGLTVLTTSRVRLGISGERVVPVAPLDPETARTLFALRAEAADPSFAITTEIAPVIAAICDRLDLLTGGPRDAPARLRDMREAIAWSHDLLPEAEQVLFRRLGVFVGGFTLDSAQAVAGEDHDALAGVSALVAASLVQRVDDGGGDEPEVGLQVQEVLKETVEVGIDDPTLVLYSQTNIDQGPILGQLGMDSITPIVVCVAARDWEGCRACLGPICRRHATRWWPTSGRTSLHFGWPSVLHDGGNAPTNE